MEGKCRQKTQNATTEFSLEPDNSGKVMSEDKSQTAGEKSCQSTRGRQLWRSHVRGPEADSRGEVMSEAETDSREVMSEDQRQSAVEKSCQRTQGKVGLVRKGSYARR